METEGMSNWARPPPQVRDQLLARGGRRSGCRRPRPARGRVAFARARPASACVLAVRRRGGARLQQPTSERRLVHNNRAACMQWCARARWKVVLGGEPGRCSSGVKCDKQIGSHALGLLSARAAACRGWPACCYNAHLGGRMAGPAQGPCEPHPHLRHLVRPMGQRLHKEH